MTAACVSAATLLVRLTFKYGSGSVSVWYSAVAFYYGWEKVKKEKIWWCSHPLPAQANMAPTQCLLRGLLWNSFVSCAVEEWVMTCLLQMSLMSHDRNTLEPSRGYSFHWTTLHFHSRWARFNSDENNEEREELQNESYNIIMLQWYN